MSKKNLYFSSLPELLLYSFYINHYLQNLNIEQVRHLIEIT